LIDDKWYGLLKEYNPRRLLQNIVFSKIKSRKNIKFLTEI